MSLANANGGLQPQHKAPLSLSVSAIHSFVYEDGFCRCSNLMYLICSHRFKIKGRVYPAILPVQNNKVYGRVCLSSYISLIILIYASII